MQSKLKNRKNRNGWGWSGRSVIYIHTVDMEGVNNTHQYDMIFRNNALV